MDKNKIVKLPISLNCISMIQCFSISLFICTISTLDLNFSSKNVLITFDSLIFTGSEHAAVLPREHHRQVERQRPLRDGLHRRRRVEHGRLQADPLRARGNRPGPALIQLQR